MTDTRAKKCPICGNPTRIYMGNARKDGLCGTHADQLKNGELFQLNEDDGLFYCTKEELKRYKKIDQLPTSGYTVCVNCGAKTTGYAFCKNCWNSMTEDDMLQLINEKAAIDFVKNQRRINNDFTKVPVAKTEQSKENSKSQTNEPIQSYNDDDEKKESIVIDPNNKSRCITCGFHTDGLLFCNNCYKKYKEKEILVKIIKCKNVELLDETYESIYRCKDGHMVKSKSERDIDNYLYEHKIQHVYEPELPYNNGTKVLHPDFKLTNYLGDGKDVYIEHWGYNEANYRYQETKKYKMPIYQEQHITLICTHESVDAKDIESSLNRKLNKAYIKENQINFDKKTQ